MKRYNIRYSLIRSQLPSVIEDDYRIETIYAFSEAHASELFKQQVFEKLKLSVLFNTIDIISIVEEI